TSTTPWLCKTGPSVGLCPMEDSFERTSTSPSTVSIWTPKRYCAVEVDKSMRLSATRTVPVSGLDGSPPTITIPTADVTSDVIPEIRLFVISKRPLDVPNHIALNMGRLNSIPLIRRLTDVKPRNGP